MKPILVILASVFVLLVIFSTTSIQVVLMVQRNWSHQKVITEYTTSPRWDSRKVCIATRTAIQSLVKTLKASKAHCIIDWGSSIGEVSLPLVKAGFLVHSIGSYDLSRMRTRLLKKWQENWKDSLSTLQRPEECILLDHNSMEVIQSPPANVKRTIQIC